MASKWDEQARIDKAVLDVLRVIGLEGAEFETVLSLVRTDRVALSKSLQRLIGQDLVTQVHAVKAGSVSRYVWVVPDALRERFTTKASA